MKSILLRQEFFSCKPSIKTISAETSNLRGDVSSQTAREKLIKPVATCQSIHGLEHLIP